MVIGSAVRAGQGELRDAARGSDAADLRTCQLWCTRDSRRSRDDPDRGVPNGSALQWRQRELGDLPTRVIRPIWFTDRCGEPEVPVGPAAMYRGPAARGGDGELGDGAIGRDAADPVTDAFRETRGSRPALP